MTRRKIAGASKQLLSVIAFSLGLAWNGIVCGQDTPIVLQSATLETIEKAGQLKGSIIIHKGKITAVGAKVTVPETAKIVTRTGKFIMPAIIDPYRVVQVGGRGAATTRTVRVRGRLFRVRSRGRFSTSFMRVGDNLDPYNLTLRPWMRSGIGHINLVSTGFGQSANVRVTPKNQTGILQSNPGRLFTSVTNSAATLNLLRKGLGPPPGSTTAKKKTSTSSSAAKSAISQLWSDVRDGKTPIIINANSPAAIIHLLKVIEPHKKVKVALVASGATIYQTVDLLKRRKPTLIISPSVVTVPNTADRFSPSRLVQDAGIPFAFSLSLNESQLKAAQDTPLFSVAVSVKAGLSRQTALAALTKAPAEILGLDKTLGTLAVGKAANLLIFNGDPLDPISRLEQVYVDGNIVYDATR